MPRRLGEEINEMRFQDNLSDSEIVLFYRMPTTKERIAYNNESFRRKGRTLIDRSVETRQKFGLKILEGFRDGDFEMEIDGEWTQISSDPKSDNFIPEWKGHVKKYAADLVGLLAIRVFDASVQTPMADENEDDIDEDLEKN